MCNSTHCTSLYTNPALIIHSFVPVLIEAFSISVVTETPLSKIMKLIESNISLAIFQHPDLKLVYLDPYNNTLGEKDWIIVVLVIILCAFAILSIFLQLGIVIFVRYE